MRARYRSRSRSVEMLDGFGEHERLLGKPYIFIKKCGRHSFRLFSFSFNNLEKERIVRGLLLSRVMFCSKHIPRSYMT